MSNSDWVQLLSYLEPSLCGLALFALIRSGAARTFASLTALLSLRMCADLTCLTLLRFSGHGVEHHLAYRLYFYTFWSAYTMEALLSLLLVYNIFQISMEPLKGLQTLGTLVFRWAAAISAAVSVCIAVGPHTHGLHFMVGAITQLRQTAGILTLCLLLFVFFAIRPMGLSFRSRISGVSFGLGLAAVLNLVDSAWMSHYPSMFSALNTVDGIAGCLSLLIWFVYFTVPEPRRRIIVLPTTSPFLRWNQISQALGDAPGFVAIGGVSPEVLAPAELEVMRRASAKMNDLGSGGAGGGPPMQSMSA